jgi:hypothetical protein
MLARMVVSTEGSRALLYRCARALDRSRALEAMLEREGDRLSTAERSDLENRLVRETTCVRLMTPLAKYLATESCGEVTRMAIQVHGGLGFMAETDVGKLHLDGIITTIYEGTSEIQVSFALKEIGRGALDAVFADLNDELEKFNSSEPHATLASHLRAGIELVLDTLPLMMRDLNHALLCSRHLAEMVIAVVVGTELLAQAKADPARIDLAVSWVTRKRPEIEMHARRIAEDGVERLERCERIVRLAN